MKKTLLAIATIAVLAIGTLAPTDADAAQRGRGRGHGHGHGVGLGIAGGLVAGAIIGGAIAAGAGPAYAYPRSYDPAYAYPRSYYPVAGYEPLVPAYGCPGGYWAHRPLRDLYGNVVGWSRPRFFCPAY